MKKYDSYKPIALPWLFEIPSHWDILRNKNIFTEQKAEVGENSSDFTLLSLTLNGIIPRDLENAKGKFPESFDKYKIVKKGNMAFCLFDIDETPRTVGISAHDGMLTGAYTIMSVNNINSQYIYYYYLSLDNAKAMKPLYSGLRKTIKTDVFQGTKIPVPPREEQDQIVRFLDWKVSEINRLISAKKREIGLLIEYKEQIAHDIIKKGINTKVSLKDSGIDYIGFIPEHWEVLLIGRIYKEKSRNTYDNALVLSLSQKDGLIPYKEMKERSLHTASYDNWKLVYPNDLVLNRFKAHLGVFFSSNYEGIVTFHYGVYEPKVSLNSKYYEQLFHTVEYKNKFAGQSNGMTVGLQNLSNRNFYSVYTVLPPIDEQQQIVEYLDKKTAEISKAIANINAQITHLQDLKNRLISDVVTGQIDVRNIEIPDYEYTEETADTPEETEADMDEEV